MDKTTELFCLIDDFCQQFEPLLKQRMLDSGGKQRRNRTGLMSLSEMTTIVVLFHTMRGRQFKEFYRGTVCRFMTSKFPRQLSYSRFVALMPRCAVVLAALFRTLKGACTGISIANSTPLAVCHYLRIPRHKVFKAVAQRGKSSTGWFYDFKLHAVINHQGELLAIKLTPGNVNDRTGLLAIASSLFGKLYAGLPRSIKKLGLGENFWQCAISSRQMRKVSCAKPSLSLIPQRKSTTWNDALRDAQ